VKYLHNLNTVDNDSVVSLTLDLMSVVKIKSGSD
jgi:hypothetical protein